MLLRNLSLAREKQLNTGKQHIEGTSKGCTKNNSGVRSFKIIVVIILNKALWGKGVLRQVLKEVWLKGERGHILI